MRGRTVVITGATSGIGEAAALELARMGARIVFVARRPSRARATMAKLVEAAPHGGHVVHMANLLLMSEVRRLAGEIAATEEKIDVLINNAGAMFADRAVTEEGLEANFAVNHMAYFILTCLLLPRLRAAGRARTVSTASDAHWGAKLDFTDLQCESDYAFFDAYSKTKLCNVLFTRELARRIAGSGVTANALHPGLVDTRLGDPVSHLQSTRFAAAMLRTAQPPEKGAESVVYLATAPELAMQSGGYYAKCAPCPVSPAARSDDDAAALWEISARLSGADIPTQP
jgi:NAD(P)-dependent dehydrogenase (short-subunit alcohol dehydrogenase family)